MLGFLTGLYPVGFEGRIHYRGLCSHRKACTSRRSVRQVPVQVPDPGIRADVPPIREAGVPQTLMKDQVPLVIQCLGTTEDPLGSP